MKQKDKDVYKTGMTNLSLAIRMFRLPVLFFIRACSLRGEARVKRNPKDQRANVWKEVADAPKGMLVSPPSV